MQLVDIFVTGRLLPGTSRILAAAQLAELTHIKKSLADIILVQGKPIRIKKKVKQDVAERHRLALHAIGVEVVLQPAKTGAEKINPTPTRLTKTSPAVQVVSAKRKTQLTQKIQIVQPTPAMRRAQLRQAGLTSSLEPLLSTKRSSSMQEAPGPIQPPHTSMRANRQPGKFPLAPQQVPAIGHKSSKSRSALWISSPRAVPASHGAEWLWESWRLFREKPFQWLGYTLLFSLLLGFFLFSPYAHLFYLVIGGPILFGFLVVAAHNQYQLEIEETPMSFLEAAQGGKVLFGLGFCTLLAFLLVGAGCFLAAGAGLFGEGRNPANLYLVLRADSPLALSLYSIFLLGSISVLSGYWFSIPLLALTGGRPLSRFQLALRTSWMNRHAMLLASLIVSLLAFALLGLAYVLYSFMPLLWPLLALFLLLSFCLALAVGTLAMYVSFRDIFLA